MPSVQASDLYLPAGEVQGLASFKEPEQSSVHNLSTQLECVLKSPDSLHSDSESGLGQGLRCYTSDKLPGDANSAGPRTTL